jgi:hypothetical protein
MSRDVHINEELLYSFDHASRELGVSVHPEEIPELLRRNRVNDKSLPQADIRLPNPENPDDPYIFHGVKEVYSLDPGVDGYLFHAKRPDQESDGSKRHGIAGLARRLLHPSHNER